MSLLQSITILAIDDDPLDLIILEDFLQLRCKQLWLETDINSALLLTQEKQPDVILLDILMGQIDGYQVCQHLKANPDTANIPVIFLSSLARCSDKVKGFQVGGVDYISKPFHIEEVVARVENCVNLHRQIQEGQVIAPYKQQEKIASYQLSKRELEVLISYVAGKQRNEIAQQLFISEHTVKSHLKRLFTKLGIKNRAQAIEKAGEIGLINSYNPDLSGF